MRKQRIHFTFLYSSLVSLSLFFHSPVLIQDQWEILQEGKDKSDKETTPVEDKTTSKNDNDVIVSQPGKLVRILALGHEIDFFLLYFQ